MRIRRPTIGASSELETCAHVFWNVLERELLVSASCDASVIQNFGLGVYLRLRVLVEVKPAHGSHSRPRAGAEMWSAVRAGMLFMDRTARAP